MLQEFKKFVLRGNVIDMAIGITVGTAFTALVKSFVNDVIMPPIGILLGGMDFSKLYILLKAGDPAPPYASLAEATEAGATALRYGVFINAIISLLIIAFVMFAIVRAMNRMQPEQAPAAPTTKKCPFCLSDVPLEATRCAHCTSDLPTKEA